MGNLETFEAGYTAKTAEYDDIAKELAASKAEFAAYERKDVKYREDLKHAKEKEKKLKDTVKKETAKVGKETKALAEHEAAAELHEEKVSAEEQPPPPAGQPYCQLLFVFAGPPSLSIPIGHRCLGRRDGCSNLTTD
eukprot:SAG22_NODE_103_length_20175_cov_15.280833_18_plen_137_part_00